MSSVTYGETGQVCQNWMQYRLIKKYLEQLTDEQTLVVMSGHPLGLFHSHKMAPRVIISNGLMVGTFDDQENFNRAAALGVANYGQMTAGGWMYIGPQGIVHGTFNTLLNAGRLKLGIPNDQNLAGRLFVSAGLGGMSGAQGKAAEIAGRCLHHRRGRRFPYRDPLHPGLGQPPHRLSRRGHQDRSRPPEGRQALRCRLLRQHCRPARVPVQQQRPCRPDERPDLLPRSL